MSNIFFDPINKTGKKISTDEYTLSVKVNDFDGDNNYVMSFPQCLDDLTEEQRQLVIQELLINLALKK